MVISLEIVAKRLSAFYSAEAKAWRPECKDNRDVFTILTRWLLAHNIH